MKKVLLFVVLALMLFTSEVFAQVRFCYSSGVLATSTVVSKLPVLLTDVSIYTDGTNAVTVTVYDSSTAATTGTVIAKAIVPGAALSGGVFIPVPVKTTYGVYVVVSGTGGTAMVCTSPE